MEKLVIEADKDRLDEVTDSIDEWLEEAGCPMRTRLQIRLAVEEIFVNIASYAYPVTKGSVEIERCFLDGQSGARIRLIDQGVPFNPLEKEDADTSENALMEREGGLGILLVKKTMDHVFYARENGRNILTVEKKW